MRSSSVILVLIVLIALGVFAYTLIHATFYSPETTGPAPATSQAENVPPGAMPSRLIIPSLSVNTHVQDLGINSIGNMQAPNNFVDVGWYKYGTVPGYRGSAVIDGHVDNGLGLPGIFLHLNQLKVGDDVYVKTVAGDMEHFVVNDVEVYPYQNVPTTQVFEQNDAARLNLVTCDGTWVHGKDTYNERLVIYTKLVGTS